MGITLIYRRKLLLKKPSDLFALLFIILFCFLRLGSTVEKDLILCVQTFSVVSWKEQFFITTYFSNFNG